MTRTIHASLPNLDPYATNDAFEEGRVSAEELADLDAKHAEMVRRPPVDPEVEEQAMEMPLEKLGERITEAVQAAEEK